MKKLLLISLLSLSSTSALAASLISTDVYSNGKVERSCGFSEDGFSTPESVCFKGEVDEVCGMIRKQQGELDAQFSDGGHGRFEVQQCSVVLNGSTQFVKLSYTQQNDYDGTKDVQLDIAKCAARISCN